MKDSARSNQGQGAVAILEGDYRRNPPWRPTRNRSHRHSDRAGPLAFAGPAD
jgi:hypothetical protein